MPARRLAGGIVRPDAITIEVDGERIEAFPGESLAASLLVTGRRAFRITAGGAPRGPLCNMGVCFDCVVSVDGLGEVRACMVEAASGMVVRTGARGNGAG